MSDRKMGFMDLRLDFYIKIFLFYIVRSGCTRWDLQMQV